MTSPSPLAATSAAKMSTISWYARPLVRMRLRTSVLPSATVRIGWICSMVPRSAEAPPMRPPRRRYSKVAGAKMNRLRSMNPRAASAASTALARPAAALAAASTAKPSSMELDRESTISMTACGCRSTTWSLAISAVAYVPLISEDRNTATTSSPEDTRSSNTWTISATEGCEEVGIRPDAASRRQNASVSMSSSRQDVPSSATESDTSGMSRPSDISAGMLLVLSDTTRTAIDAAPLGVPGRPSENGPGWVCGGAEAQFHSMLSHPSRRAAEGPPQPLLRDLRNPVARARYGHQAGTAELRALGRQAVPPPAGVDGDEHSTGSSLSATTIRDAPSSSRGVYTRSWTPCNPSPTEHTGHRVEEFDVDRTRIAIMGAAGRDFHNFQLAYRGDETVEVVAFTATQIPGIDKRTYPTELAGPLYPEGIPIVPESDLPRLIRDEGVQRVDFAYSDIAHIDLMHKASAVLALGADFAMLGPDRTMLKSNKPVISVCAVRPDPLLGRGQDVGVVH